MCAWAIPAAAVPITMRSLVQQRRRCARGRVEGRKDLPSNFYERRVRERGAREAHVLLFRDLVR